MYFSRLMHAATVMQLSSAPALHLAAELQESCSMIHQITLKNNTFHLMSAPSDVNSSGECIQQHQAVSRSAVMYTIGIHWSMY